MVASSRLLDKAITEFYSLRMVMALLRSISVHLDRSSGEPEASVRAREALESLDHYPKASIQQLAVNMNVSTILLSLSLLSTAIAKYQDIVSRNRELAHDPLQERLRQLQEIGILNKMRLLRNSVFHMRNDAQHIKMAGEITRDLSAHGIHAFELENLLYEAIRAVFRKPEEMYGVPRAVLMDHYRQALEYYREHVAPKEAVERTDSERRRGPGSENC